MSRRRYGDDVKQSKPLKPKLKRVRPPKAEPPAPAPPKRKPKAPPPPPVRQAPLAKVSERAMYLRVQAGLDYAFSDTISIGALYARDDRSYRDEVPEATFRAWSAEDQWAKRREMVWGAIESTAERLAVQTLGERRLAELTNLEAAFGAYLEWMMPLRDESGALKRDPETGLPMFALGMPAADKAMKMMLALHERIELLRGKPTARTVIEGEMPASGGWQDSGGDTFNVSDDELQAIAIALQMKRDPELLEGYESLPDAEQREHDDGT